MTAEVNNVNRSLKRWGFVEKPSILSRPFELESLAVRNSNSRSLRLQWMTAGAYWVAYGEQVFRHLFALLRHGFDVPQPFHLLNEFFFDVILVMAKVLWMLSLAEDQLNSLGLSVIDEEVEGSPSHSDDEAGNHTSGNADSVEGEKSDVDRFELDTVIDFNDGVTDDGADESGEFIYVWRDDAPTVPVV